MKPARLAFLSLSLTTYSVHAIDLNSNKINDVFEALHPEIALTDPTLDSDGDGVTNFSEAQALTDPTDPTDCFKCLPLTETAASYIIRWPSKEGLRYQAQHSTNGVDWDFIGTEFTGTGAILTSTVSKADLAESEGNFFRARVTSEVDTDGDSIADWAEAALGFSATDANSVRSAANGGDAQHLTNLLTGGNPSGGLLGTDTPGIPSPEMASRFLAQASFGPSYDSITELRALGSNAYEKWIDAQQALPPSYLSPYIQFLDARKESDNAAFLATGQLFPWTVNGVNDGNRVSGLQIATPWMRTALFGEDQLRLRTAFALSQIIVCGRQQASFTEGLTDFYDLMVTHAFGSYRDLLRDVTLHPMMGFYLSSLGNQQADLTIGRLPDENYAREIMQLFSIGLFELNMDGSQKLNSAGEPIETYDIDDVQEMARVFTGFWHKGYPFGSSPTITMQEDWANDPMTIHIGLHDSGEKVLLNGVVLPAFSTTDIIAGRRFPINDIEDTIDMLVNHENCPPFISKQLIQFLVTSNPTPGYVERVATIFANDGTGQRGNLGAVIKAILLDEEARHPLPDLARPEAGMLREPLIRTTMLARITEAGAASPALHDETGIQFFTPITVDDFLQYPLDPPSVFNYYSPSYAHPGEIRNEGLLSPAFQILNSATAISSLNQLWAYTQDGFHTRTSGGTPSFHSDFNNLPRTLDVHVVIDDLNLLYANGRFSAEGRSQLGDAMNNQPFGVRALMATGIMLAAPEAVILK